MIDENVEYMIRMHMFLSLGTPITHHTERCHNQRWSSSPRVIRNDQGQDLDGFPQSHVVGKNAAFGQRWGLRSEKVCGDVQIAILLSLPQLNHIG